jgi:nucleolar protein 53
MLASIGSAKSLRRSMEKGAAARAKVVAEREAKLKEKLRGGLAGSKLGRHRVGAGEIDVQLGEDLSESLRGLKVSPSRITIHVAEHSSKPEGNLFRDRFLSLQQRGLVEPRALVLYVSIVCSSMLH